MSRVLRLTLVCHGMTTASRLAGFPADEPLAEGERERAGRIIAMLGRFERLSSAPALAARQTADVISADYVIDPTFRDLSLGRWAGERLADVQAREPGDLDRWREDATAAPHGGESIAGLLERVSDWMESQRAAGGHHVIVTHPSVIKAMVLTTLAAPPLAFWNVDVEHLSLTDIRSDGRRFALRSFGRVL